MARLTVYAEDTWNGNKTEWEHYEGTAEECIAEAQSDLPVGRIVGAGQFKITRHELIADESATDGPDGVR